MNYEIAILFILILLGFNSIMLTIIVVILSNILNVIRNHSVNSGLIEDIHSDVENIDGMICSISDDVDVIYDKIYNLNKISFL